MSTWNYRILACEYENGTISYSIHEVHYNEDSIPEGYTNKSISAYGETPEELKADFGLMQKAFSKPILWYGDRFPEEYKK